jgi:hypothetical protein
MKKNFGIVLMVDALGVSNYTIEECEKFLKIQKRLSKHMDLLRDAYGESDFHYKYSHTSTFGDTIVFCYPIDTTKELPRPLIAHVIVDAAHIVALGIELGALFRGCISVGEYLYEENIVLGPAIFDAARWYESADWMGVIVSPESQPWFDSIFENDTEKKIMNRFLENFLVCYKVPMSHPDTHEITKELWSVGWPSTVYRRSEENNKSPNTYIRHLLSDFKKSKKGKIKVKNSLDFFEWHYRKRYKEYTKFYNGLEKATYGYVTIPKKYIKDSPNSETRSVFY